MMRLLLKRQLMEAFSWIYRSRRGGKRRSARGMLACGAMYLAVFLMLAAVFYKMADGLYPLLAQTDALWLYWALMGLLALVLGVFGSVFGTASSLYQAKDNDFLLALPIRPCKIVFSRLAGVYLVGLAYVLIAAMPTMFVWFLHAPVGCAGKAFTLLLPVLLSLLVLFLSTVLGWAAAWISGRCRQKNLVIVAASMAFIMLYYYAYARAFAMLQTLLANVAAMEGGLRIALYPLYCMGMAAQGSICHMLIFTGMAVALCALMIVVLSKSFLQMTSARHGASKLRRAGKFAEQRSKESALLRREWARFSGSANYMLNCGLGVFFMPVAAVVLLWKAEALRGMLALLPDSDWAALIAVCAVCSMSTLCDLTAPSVSLEGRELQLVQALPVRGWDVLLAKLKLHLLLALPSAALLMAALLWLLRPAAIFLLLMPLTVALYIVLIAALGLTANLKLPNLEWSSEIVPIKQGASVAITLFGGLLIVAALAGAYLLLHSFVAPAVYLVLVCGLLLAADAGLLHWLLKQGAQIFEALCV